IGSWLHAFRPYVEPPIEGGIWDHAHDDYLELAAETGIAGVAVILAFAVSVVRTIRRRRDASETSPEPDVPADFRRGDWARALGDMSELRWGLAGGLVAILVHSAVDFSLHMPANLLLAMTIIGLLVLSGRPARVGRSPALGLLLATFVVALVPRAANSVLVVAGGTPLAPEDCLRTADLTLAAEGEPARPRALALVHRALDRSPADRDAHTALAEALGPGPEGDEALRRALALEPWSADVRDQLGLRLLARGEREAGAAELEESMYRFPYLASHAYLSADVDSAADPARLVRALAEGARLRRGGAEPARSLAQNPRARAALPRPRGRGLRRPRRLPARRAGDRGGTTQCARHVAGLRGRDRGPHPARVGPGRRRLR